MPPRCRRSTTQNSPGRPPAATKSLPTHRTTPVGSPPWVSAAAQSGRRADDATAHAEPARADLPHSPHPSPPHRASQHPTTGQDHCAAGPPRYRRSTTQNSPGRPPAPTNPLPTHRTTPAGSHHESRAAPQSSRRDGAAAPHAKPARADPRQPSLSLVVACPTAVSLALQPNCRDGGAARHTARPGRLPPSAPSPTISLAPPPSCRDGAAAPHTARPDRPGAGVGRPGG